MAKFDANGCTKPQQDVSQFAIEDLASPQIHAPGDALEPVGSSRSVWDAVWCWMWPLPLMPFWRWVARLLWGDLQRSKGLNGVRWADVHRPWWRLALHRGLAPCAWMCVGLGVAVAWSWLGSLWSWDSAWIWSWWTWLQ
ncbi:MAG: hypothetical protein ACKVW3_11845 [Phycisphaerales bacterium]